jgi:hypothetical protein
MREAPGLQVVSTADRPELAPVVATWLWEESRRRHGHSLEETHTAAPRK